MSDTNGQHLPKPANNLTPEQTAANLANGHKGAKTLEERARLLREKLDGMEKRLEAKRAREARRAAKKASDKVDVAKLSLAGGVVDAVKALIESFRKLNARVSQHDRTHALLRAEVEALKANAAKDLGRMESMADLLLEKTNAVTELATQLGEVQAQLRALQADLGVRP